MYITKLDCPNCGASIEVEQGIDSFDCPSCGCRIIINETGHDETKGTVSRETGQRKSPVQKVFVSLLVLAVLGGTIGIVGRGINNYEIKENTRAVREAIKQNDYSSAKTELSNFDGHMFFCKKWESHKNELQREIEEKEEKYLLDILDEKTKQIQELIDKGDYEKARDEINLYSPPENVLEEWKTKREQLLKTINEKETELSKGIEQSKSYPAPISKKEAKNSSRDFVEKKFREAGFNNIETIMVTDKPALKKVETGDIKEITVFAGEEEIKDFDEGTALLANAKITIVYYDFNTVTAEDGAPVPISSDDAKKKNYDFVYDLFEKAGFKNVDSKKETQKPSFPQKAESKKVKEITILFEGENKTKFKKGDRYPIDSKITITYYEFGEGIPVPMSAKEAKGKNYREVKEAFDNAGFVNVFLREDTKKPGGLKRAKSGEVKEVSIKIDENEANKSFKKDDLFPANTRIDIIFYDFGS